MSIKPLHIISSIASLWSLAACATAPMQTGGECIEGTQITSPLGALGGVQSTRYNKECGLNQAARVMMKTDDTGLRAAGALIIKKLDPNAAKAIDHTATTMANPNGKLSCKVTAIDYKTGKALIDCKDPLALAPAVH